MEVGIRELRDHLSRYVEMVRGGTEITVTDHGRAVAQLAPLGSPRLFDQLVADGLVTRATSKKQPISDENRPAIDGLIPLVADQRR